LLQYRNHNTNGMRRKAGKAFNQWTATDTKKKNSKAITGGESRERAYARI